MLLAAEIPGFAVPLGIAFVAVIAAIIIFRSMWRVPEPNQALIISGLNRGKDANNTAAPNESHGFRISVGRGKFVIPGVQRVRTLNLDLHEANLVVECVTNQAVPVIIKGVVIYKVGDDETSISNAARRFIDQEDQMDAKVHNVFAGHMRSIIGNLTVEQLIREREMLTEQVRSASEAEVQKLGLVIDSMQILEIDDPSDYITNLGAPQQAAIASAARVAKADADRTAAEAEQIARAQIAAATRDTNIKTAGFQAEVDKANEEAKQAGPLAEATARQAVIDQQAKAAEREAERATQELLATVIRPAEAEASATRTRADAARDKAIAEAEAEAAQTTKVGQAKASVTEVTGAAEAAATKATGLATAEVVKATGLAEAEVTGKKGEAEGTALKARAEGLAANQEAVINQQMAERLPEIVAAAAHAFDNVDSMVVLNGATGVVDAVAQIATQGMAMYGGLKDAFAHAETPVTPVASVGASSTDEAPDSEAALDA